MDFLDEPKELVVRLNNNVGEIKSKTTFFFERIIDGESVPVDDPQVAWDYYTRRRQDFRYVGQSDGKAFIEALKESRKVFKEQGLEASQEVLRQAAKAELEIAKQNPAPPMNADVFGNGAQRLMANLSKYGG